MAYKRVKGTQDFFPEEKSVQNKIFSVLRDTAVKYGFLEVEAPAIETTELLTAKSGEETKKQIFTIEKKSEEEIALRYDLTVPFTRMFVEKQRELAKPVKWFGISRVWRYEAPQKGRFREFYQLSVEMYGSDKAEADAEVVELAIECLRRLGLQKEDFEVRINNKNLIYGLIKEIVGDKIDDVLAIVDKKSRLKDNEFKAILQDILRDGAKVEQIFEITFKDDAKCALQKIQKFKMNAQAQKGYEELRATIDFLTEYYEYITVDLSIVRGLAYYTGTIFEIFDRSGEFRAVAGGGRYDNLVGLFGGESTPATGFGIGDKTLTLLLEKKKLLPDSALGPEYYIAPVDETVIKEARVIARQLREKTTVDIDLQKRKLAKQFEYANTIGAKKIIIVGDKDLKEGSVTVKNLSTGEQTKVKIESL